MISIPGLAATSDRRISDRRVSDGRVSDRSRSNSDEGFATIWTAGAILVLVALFAFGMQLAAATSGRHRAEAAADLAALAAAGHAIDGEPVACAYAARIAHGMATRLVSCRLSGWEALVEVGVRPAFALLGGGDATGRARGGPAAG